MTRQKSTFTTEIPAPISILFLLEVIKFLKNDSTSDKTFPNCEFSNTM